MRTTFPKQCVTDCTRPGEPADEAVRFWRERLRFRVPREKATAYLAEVGAWTREELADSSPERLAELVLWVACGDQKEDGEWLGLER